MLRLKTNNLPSLHIMKKEARHENSMQQKRNYSYTQLKYTVVVSVLM